MGAMGGEEQQQWAGTIKCGCGTLTVLLQGPAHLFRRRSEMLRYAAGEECPFDEDDDGRLICRRCNAEIVATRHSERRDREASAD